MAIGSHTEELVGTQIGLRSVVVARGDFKVGLIRRSALQKHEQAAYVALAALFVLCPVAAYGSELLYPGSFSLALSSAILIWAIPTFAYRFKKSGPSIWASEAQKAGYEVVFLKGWMLVYLLFPVSMLVLNVLMRRS